MSRDEPVRRISAWLRQHGLHIVFILSLTSLTLLILWWAVFIRTSIVQQYHNQYENLRNSALFNALKSGNDRSFQPIPGPIANDERLEIRKNPENPGPYSAQLLPFHPEYWVVPRLSFIREIEAEYTSKTIMVFGESALLILIIGISMFMLFRILWLEKRADMELHEFWSRVTHELKTPITGIKAFLETLKAQDIPREELIPLIDMALKQVDRQERLAENILIGRRLEKHTRALHIRLIAIAEFLTDFFRTNRLYIPEDRLRFRNSGMEDAMVRADPDALRVILENIIDNAVKYSGEELVLNVELLRKDNDVIIRLRDNGPGFPTAMSQALFRAFRRFRDELPGQVHGTGMGLYIARRLAREMGGELTAYSAGKGQGAQFDIHLPGENSA